MGRRQKFLLNAVTALLQQGVTIMCGFILPVYILQGYGSAVNGLVSSITQFLGFISLLEMGVGPVIQSNLYRPLANGDTASIRGLYAASEQFFRRLAMIFLAYLALLMVIYPSVVSESFDFLYTASLILIIAVSIFAQYYFGLSTQLLLGADQRGYIPSGLQTITLALNTLLSVCLIQQGASIHLVKLVAAGVYVLRPVGMAIYAKHHYRLGGIDAHERMEIQQKWNGFSQHLAAVVSGSAGVVLLTLFAPIESVSVYSVYSMIKSGVESLFLNAVNGLEGLWGNMIARQERQLLYRTFAVVEWATHWGFSSGFHIPHR